MEGQKEGIGQRKGRGRDGEWEGVGIGRGKEEKDSRGDGSEKGRVIENGKRGRVERERELRGIGEREGS